MNSQEIFGLVLFSLFCIFVLFNTKWKHWSAWIGLALIVLPYIHIFTVSDQISENLRCFYSFVIIIGMILFLFVNSLYRKDKNGFYY